jgi:hypothetical protein
MSMLNLPHLSPHCQGILLVLLLIVQKKQTPIHILSFFWKFEFACPPFVIAKGNCRRGNWKLILW